MSLGPCTEYDLFAQSAETCSGSGNVLNESTSSLTEV